MDGVGVLAFLELVGYGLEVADVWERVGGIGWKAVDERFTELMGERVLLKMEAHQLQESSKRFTHRLGFMARS